LLHANDATHPEWRQLCQAALFETNTVKLLERITLARHAVLGGRFRLGRATPPSSILQDPYGLLALTQEIARLLEEKERRLKGQLPATDESSS
jgi:hypothetical protein